MTTITCNALLGESRVPPSETRGPLTRSKSREASNDEETIAEGSSPDPRKSNCGGTLSPLIAAGETNVPVARTSVIDS